MRTNEVDKECLIRSVNKYGLADAIADKRPESLEIERLTREFLSKGGQIKDLGSYQKSEAFDPTGKIDWRGPRCNRLQSTPEPEGDAQCLTYI